MANKTRGTFASPGNFEVQIKAPIDSRLQACLYTDLISEEYWKSIDESVYLYKGIVVPVTNGSAFDLYMLTGDPTTTPTCYQSYANWKKIGSESDVYLINGAFFSLSTGDFSQLQSIVGTVADFKAAFFAHKIFLVYHHTTSNDNILSVVSVSANSNTAPVQYTIDTINANTRFTYTLTCNASSWTGLTVTRKSIAFEGEVVKSVTPTADKGIEIGGTTTEPTVGLKIDSTGNVSLTTSAKGLKADIGATPESITSLLAEDDKVLDAARLASGRYAISSTLGLTYDNGTKKINLTGKNSAVIATIDATDFIKDGMVQSVDLEGNNLVITFNTDAGAEPISVDLSKFLDVYTAGNGITISGKSIAAKVDPDTEQFLTVGANGLKISGIHAEITEAVSQALTWTEVGE